MVAEKDAEGIAGLTEKRREASSNYIEGEGDVIRFGNGHLLICNAVHCLTQELYKDKQHCVSSIELKIYLDINNKMLILINVNNLRMCHF